MPGTYAPTLESVAACTLSADDIGLTRTAGELVDRPASGLRCWIACHWESSHQLRCFASHQHLLASPLRLWRRSFLLVSSRLSPPSTKPQHILLLWTKIVRSLVLGSEAGTPNLDLLRNRLLTQEKTSVTTTLILYPA